MSSVIVRKAIRHDVAIRAAIRVAPVHADIVRLSNSSSAQNGWLVVDCIDASLSGLGFIATTFFPRMTRIEARLHRGAEGEEVLVECPCIIRRVIMTDRRPAYHLGCSFGDMSPEVQAKIEAILNSLDETG